jgi:tRNA(Leu) C34 or U34 (ribose-2'-O)-methylase TrmL
MRGYAAIGLYAPKTGETVGGAMRAAGCYEAAMIVIEGARYHKQRTDTQQTWRHIPVIHGPLFDLMPLGCDPVIVELHPRARSLPDFVHPERAFYIFGPEDGSVPNEVIEKCQRIVQVPTKYCMNLAATVNVVLYDRLAKAKR